MEQLFFIVLPDVNMKMVVIKIIKDFFYFMGKNQIVTFLLIILINGCEKERIEPDKLITNLKSNNYKIVIDGAVLTIPGHQFVKLSMLNYQFGKDSSTPVSDADISVSDGERVFDYYETSIPGEYFSNEVFKAMPNKKYTLHVRIQENYYFASDSIKINKKIDILPINEIIAGNSGRIFTTSLIHNFGYVDNNIWIQNNNTDSLNIPVNLSPKEIIEYPIKLYTHKSALPQGLFPTGFSSTGDAGEPNDTTEYIKLSLSDNYYKYLISMFNLTDWSSGIFSTIPGNTYTNVSEGGTGYFFASDVKKIRVQYKDLKTIDE